MAGGGVAPGAVNFLENQRRLGNPEAAAPVGFGNQRGQPTPISKGFDEAFGVSLLGIELTPIFAGEVGADFSNGLPDLLLFGSERRGHARG